MRIAFAHCLYESLGIEYISSYLKKEGHEVRLFFDPVLFDNYLIKNRILDKIFTFKNKLIDAIVKNKPDVVAFSVLSDNYIWCCRMAEEIKKRLKTTIVFGGIHPTAVPHRVLKNGFVDFVVCGEGEETMAILADHLAQGKNVESIENLGYKTNSETVVNKLRPLLKNLDSMPFPDKALFFNEHNDFIGEAYMIVTARGCPYQCSYCCENLMDKLYGKYHRRRTPDHVIDELLWAKKRYGIKRVNFQDSVFTYDRHWLEDFLPKYKAKINLPFFCFIYPSAVIDEKLIGLLTDAGCVTVNMGVQSINPELRKKIFLRNETNKEIIRVVDLIKKTNLYLYLDFVLWPWQTESELIETLKFCARMGADFVAVAWLIYYPGTEIIIISKNLGLLTQEDIDSIEEVKYYMPYAQRERVKMKIHSKIANFMFLSGLLPLFFMRAAIKVKGYRYMTSRNLFLPLIIIVGLIKQFVKKKSPFSYRSVLIYFGKYYYMYMKRRFINKT